MQIDRKIEFIVQSIMAVHVLKQPRASHYHHHVWQLVLFFCLSDFLNQYNQ